MNAIRHAKLALCAMNLAVLLASLTGCSRKPAPPATPAPTVADLHFPVVVLYPRSLTSLFKDADDLHVMYTQVVINLDEAPTLIDSDFHIYSMQKLHSIHGGLWLMANPNNGTEVTFELQRAPQSGLQAALDAMSAQLDKQTWHDHDELDKLHAKLARQKTLAGMFNIVKADQ